MSPPTVLFVPLSMSRYKISSLQFMPDLRFSYSCAPLRVSRSSPEFPVSAVLILLHLVKSSMPINFRSRKDLPGFVQCQLWGPTVRGGHSSRAPDIQDPLFRTLKIN